MSSDKNIWSSDLRFDQTYSEAIKQRQLLRDDFSVTEDFFDQAEDEDLKIKVRCSTSIKSRRNLLISIACIIIGLFFLRNISIGFALGIIGVIGLVSSSSGILSNKITNQQKRYIEN